MTGSLAKRRQKVAELLASSGIAAALFEDAEGRRDQAIRYLSGQIGDSLLLITADGRSILVAWDLNMAHRYGEADEILAYSDFERLPHRALGGMLERLGIPSGSKVELPSTFAYLRYVKFVEELPDYDFVCREDGLDELVLSMRARKDEAEIAIYRRAAAITDGLMDRIEKDLRSGSIATELELALLIERECRAAGCEGTGFETLAAGPARSFGIHAFPPFGSGPFGSEGMSILDFGVRLEGYTTDVTMTFLRGKLGSERERMVELVLAAREAAIGLIKPGTPTRQISAAVTAVFAQAGLAMPHGLGHGIGLDAHESPSLRDRDDNVDVLKSGHIIAVEPGLYHSELGGVRYEDDYLVTEGGMEVLTHSRIVRL